VTAGGAAAALASATGECQTVALVAAAGVHRLAALTVTSAMGECQTVALVAAASAASGARWLATLAVASVAAVY
jgi:hypothetical protein